MNLTILLSNHPTTPVTTNFMILGYVVIFGIMLLYVLSLFWRSRNLKLELDLLEEMEEE